MIATSEFIVNTVGKCRSSDARWNVKCRILDVMLIVAFIR